MQQFLTHLRQVARLKPRIRKIDWTQYGRDLINFHVTREGLTGEAAEERRAEYAAIAARELNDPELLEQPE